MLGALLDIDSDGLPLYRTVLGHREVGDTIPEVLRVGTGYQFDDDMESAISIYATETKRDAKVRLALTNLTFADVYWISKIENPLVIMLGMCRY